MQMEQRISLRLKDVSVGVDPTASGRLFQSLDVDRGRVLIYIFLKVLWDTRIKMLVNEGCSFKSDYLCNR